MDNHNQDQADKVPRQVSDQSNKDWTAEYTKASLGALPSVDGYRVLKAVAETMVANYEGYGLPNGTPEAEKRYANAALIRKAFNLLWAQVEEMGRRNEQPKSFVGTLLEAATKGPIAFTKEVENL